MAVDNKQVMRRLVDEVWNQGKLEVINELFDKNYKGHDPLLGELTRDGFREAMKGYRSAFPDLKFEITAILADGNYVCTRWVGKGTHRGALGDLQPTGKSATVTGIDFAELRDGRVVADYTEFDTLGFMKQLGATEGALGVPTAARPEPRVKQTL